MLNIFSSAFLWKISTQILCLFFIPIICFLLLLSCMSSFIYFGINLLLEVSFANIFAHLVDCLFGLMVSSAVQKLFSLLESRSFIFACFLCLWSQIPKTSLWPMSRSLVPVLSSMYFIVSGFTFKSLIRFELISVYVLRQQCSFILLHVTFQLSQHHILKRLSFLHCVFLAPLSNTVYPCTCDLISGLSVLFHWSLCVFI